MRCFFNFKHVRGIIKGRNHPITDRQGDVLMLPSSRTLSYSDKQSVQMYAPDRCSILFSIDCINFKLMSVNFLDVGSRIISLSLLHFDLSSATDEHLTQLTNICDE